MLMRREEQHSIPWEPFYNGTNEKIDAHSCIRLTTSKTVNGNIFSVCAKPNGYGAQFHHRLTYETPVEPQGIGYCSIPVGFPMLAAYDTQDGKPSAFQSWGPADGFTLRKDVGGFRVLGEPPGSQLDRVVLVYFEPLLQVTAVLTADLGGGAEVTANPIINGTTDTTLEVTVSEVLGASQDIAVGTKVIAGWDTVSQQFHVSAAGCP